MALSLVTALPTAVLAEYWNIKQIRLSQTEKKAEVFLALYKDASARLANREPVLIKSVKFEGDAYPFSPEAMKEKNVYKLAYEALCSLPEFSQATNV